MESVIIYATPPIRSQADEFAGKLREKGAQVDVVDVDADAAAASEVEKLAGDIPADDRYPLVRVGVPKIRGLLWKPEVDDVQRAVLDSNGMKIPGLVRDITVYSTTWCPDCRRMKRFLEENGLTWSERNIDETTADAEWVLRHSGGRRVVPSFLIDGRIALFNPSEEMLGRLLGL